MPILKILVGLPGSGKSHRIAQLKTSTTGLSVDDFMKDIPLNAPVRRDPRFTDSKHYSTLIKDLRNGLSCVISDIIFCDTLLRLEAEAVLRADVPKLRIEWEFFENNPRQCKINATQRGKNTLRRELKLIDYLSRKYIVPQNSKVLPVWSGKKSRITNASKRPRSRGASR